MFGAWLKAEFPRSARSATNYMSVVSAIPDSALVADLAPSTVYRLASKSTPAAVREEILRRRGTGEAVSAAEIETLLDAAREKAREAHISPNDTNSDKQEKGSRRPRSGARRGSGKANESGAVEAGQRAASAIASLVPGDVLRRALAGREGCEAGFDHGLVRGLVESARATSKSVDERQGNSVFENAGGSIATEHLSIPLAA